MSQEDADKIDFEPIRGFLSEHERFLLLTHIGPDGDGLLACVAMSRYLRTIDKHATVVIEGATPVFLAPYDPEGLVRTREELLAHEDWAKHFDAILVVDTGKPERIGKIRHAVVESKLPVAVIDHHIREEGDFDGPSVIDISAASVGQIIAEYFDSEGYSFEDLLVVRALFATLSYDTGHFRFTNTTEQTFRWASRLVELGAKPSEAFAIFWESNSVASLKLLGHLMNDLHIECGGRLGWFAMSGEDLEKFGVKREETEEYISVPRSIASLEVIAQFSEINKNLIRVSLRSKGRISIHEVALRFGGGGHAFAAGARIPDTLENASKMVAEALTEKIRVEMGPD
ncbi:MAG: hypothetical protein HOC91_03915 [Nitrospinaceae bacterium]|jgi:bifunctional oligoribonuclease and PAP phosphatase NrnA|nr:hypothetical protein [Nitrospinaceae bacterium]MBT3433824.1 hypothetical protein [Nitrospinaceae bacterium]MBT3821965.1 hypothetical protein [Nitrospinaceae bacterium]MBT4093260.1 hypothetical protein [Nitrospinaceae bacterium]MBT4429640.1 hypothetical protein [Nitrospinaceae bacterium]